MGRILGNILSFTMAKGFLFPQAARLTPLVLRGSIESNLDTASNNLETVSLEKDLRSFFVSTVIKQRQRDSYERCG